MKSIGSPLPTESLRTSDPLSALPAFDFQPLTRVVFGPGSLARLGDLVRELDGMRVLLVTDPGLEAAGHPQRAVESLRGAGREVFVFDAVEENPTTKHVDQALAFARTNRIDFIVAVGGGSSMDCAKGVNFLLTNGGAMADYMGFGKASKPMLPSIGVPTTSGTGSEGQSFALIADEQTHMKMACGDRKAAFRVAILDPEVTVSQPKKVTAITGIDALAHALETYVTTRRTPLSQTFSREAWKLLEPNFEIVLREPDNVEARSAMQLGAHFAGVAIENSMLGACHACANPLTAHYGMTHGIAIGILLPHVIRFNGPVVGDLYGELAHGAGLVNGDEEIAAEALAERITRLVKIADLPTRLSEFGVSDGIFPLLADEAAQQWTGRYNPRPVDHAALLQLYQAAA
ncbi:MAG TPA: iron-containing alcohol dehydrogenase [Gemmataceae bacterium]|jgi:alcohol dehydrogenase|nr:iron-containing alcohol dehydrogenase [Gemmataceae bacterium]